MLLLSSPLLFRDIPAALDLADGIALLRAIGLGLVVEGQGAGVMARGRKQDHETRASSSEALNHPFIANALAHPEQMLHCISVWVNNTLQVPYALESFAPAGLE